MVLFLVVAGVLIAAVVAMLSYRLWKASPPVAASATDEQAVDAIGVLRDQRRELDSEVEAGRLTAEERETRVAELTRRVHEEGLTAPAAAAPPGIRHTRSRWFAALITLLVPAIAIPVYLIIGNPTAIDPAMRAAPASAHGEMTPEQVRTLLDQLKARLQQKPDDLKGWTMLGRGLRMIEDFAGSAAAYEKANALGPGDAQLLADYADSLAMTQGRSLRGRPAELIQEALKADPKLPKALALAASAEFEQQHFEAAKGYWQRLLSIVPPDSESATEVREILAQLDVRLAGGARSATPAPALPPVGTAAKSAAGAAVAATGSAPAAKAVPATSVAAISGTVRLSPALAGRVAAGDVLFIFARAVEGPRMPLAIIRASASELPRAFRLDDSMAMAGGPQISSVAQIRIEARISKSGDAMPKPGDLRGESAVAAPGMSNVDVVIDKIVP